MMVYILGSTDGDSGLYIVAVYEAKTDAEECKRVRKNAYDVIWAYEVEPYSQHED